MEIKPSILPSHKMHLNYHMAFGCATLIMLWRKSYSFWSRVKGSKPLQAAEAKANGNVIKFLKIMKNMINCHIQLL